MSRVVEWILAVVGAAICIASATFVYASGPDPRRWPFPALVILGWAVFGLAALLGVALDARNRPGGWGTLTWAATGALLGSTVVGFAEFGLLAFLAVPALTTAATLADKRRGRRTLRQLAMAAAVGATTLLLVLGLVLK